MRLLVRSVSVCEGCNQSYKFTCASTHRELVKHKWYLGGELLRVETKQLVYLGASVTPRLGRKQCKTMQAAVHAYGGESTLMAFVTQCTHLTISAGVTRSRLCHTRNLQPTWHSQWRLCLC